MPVTTLTQRQLNRALLARQMLLARETLPVVAAVERLAGLQAQEPNPPYIGLWTRMGDFQRDELTQAIEGRVIVRTPWLRSTLHLVSAHDFRRFRAVLQPALSRALNSFYGKDARSLDLPAVVAAARPFVAQAPRTTGDIRAHLLAQMPDQDGPALAYAARNHLPLVQVPPGGTWGSGAAAYLLADAWLEPAADVSTADLGDLLRRYLAAFGPASLMDFQFWTGMTRLKDALKPHLEGLHVYEDEAGRTLYDLPGAALPDADTPAPPRFMPAYDNLVISHKDRSRVISDAAYKRVFLSAARVLPTVLVDGVVAGTWSAGREGDSAVLTVTPFSAFSDEVRAALTTEGERLLRFIEAGTSDGGAAHSGAAHSGAAHRVRFERASG